MMNAKHTLSVMALAIGLMACGVAQADSSAALPTAQARLSDAPEASEVAGKRSSHAETDSSVAPIVPVASPTLATTDSVILPASRTEVVNQPMTTAVEVPSVTVSNQTVMAAVMDAPTAVATDVPSKSTAETAVSESADAASEVANSDEVMDAEFPDPYEHMNRKIYTFNDTVDKAIAKPVAKGYQKVIPKGPRLCASNIFSNLGEPYTAVNNLLQGKPKSMLQDIGRLLLNSTLGIGGCIDVASQWGIPKHQEDFGQTLAVWGVPSGPYVVLPGLGPSTVRDALSKPVDFLANPIGYVTRVPVRNSLQAYKLLDTRVNLLEVTDVVDQSALDPYVMTRDAWLQRRLAQIQDEDGGYAPADEKPRAIEIAPRSAVIE